METRRLGRLEHRSSVLIYGGAALGAVSQDVADASLDQALAAGINHVDTAAAYGDAELRIGAWLPPHRDDVFLASKTGDRDATTAYASVLRSLERLRTDRLDLLQLHAVGSIEELDLVTSPGGALEAALRARDEGLVRAVGITGHGAQAAAVHLEALRRFPFDTVLTPLSPVLARDDDYRAAYAALVDEVQRQDVGLMTIKTVARRNWPGSPSYDTWYEPFDEMSLVQAAVSWVLSHEEVTGLATPGDVRLLGMVIAAEADRVSQEEAEQTLAGAADYSSPFLAMPF
jgi:aryl-alcohol dehydrogenase-like predicted oxidoreductase